VSAENRGYSSFETDGERYYDVSAAITIVIRDDKPMSFEAWEKLRNFKGGYKLTLNHVTKTIPYSALRDCSSIVSISASALTDVENFVFASCVNLATASLPAVVTVGESAFYGTGLREISLPAAGSIGDSAFEYCKNLNKVSLLNVVECQGDSIYFFRKKL
jgi:hypothetical protein